MENKEQAEPTSGVLTERMDTTSSEFVRFQALILEKARAQSEEQKIRNNSLSLKFKREDKK